MIELVEEDQVRIGRTGGKTKGGRYEKYAKAVANLVPWLKEQITNSKDGNIRIKTNSIAVEMGSEFVKKTSTSLYWGLKFVLFNEGIVVDTGTAKDGDKLLLMRLAKEDDKLPPSLSKIHEQTELIV